MKNLFTLVILLCPALYGWADEENTAKKATDAHITGHIILKETGEHLPFMTILLIRNQYRHGHGRNRTFLPEKPTGRKIHASSAGSWLQKC